MATHVDAVLVQPTDARLVGLEADSLAEAFEGYFRQSEQLPTRILLAVDDQRAAGLMLQKLPGDSGDADARDPEHCVGRGGPERGYGPDADSAAPRTSRRVQPIAAAVVVSVGALFQPSCRHSTPDVVSNSQILTFP